jgi:hypothetical protein
VLGVDVPQTHSRDALDDIGEAESFGSAATAVLRRRFGVCGRCPWLSVRRAAKMPAATYI